MMIQMQYGVGDIYPRFSFAEDEKLRSKLVPIETVMMLKQRIHELSETVINTDIIGTEAEKDQIVGQINFLKGKIAAFKEIIEDFVEAHTITQNQS